MTPNEQRPTGESGNTGMRGRRHHLSILGRPVPLPASQVLRIALGSFFLAGGFLWFLPILGLWMLPLGLAILSVDVPVVRRWSRRASVALHRRYPETMGRLFPRPRSNASAASRSRSDPP